MLAIDEERFADYVIQLRALAARHGLTDSLDVATVLRLPDVIAQRPAAEDEGTPDQLVAVVDQAAAALARMRDEGLVTYRRDSQTLWYRIADPRIEDLLATLPKLYCKPNKRR